MTSRTSIANNTEYASATPEYPSHRHYFWDPGHSHSVDKNQFYHTHDMPHTHNVSISWSSHTHTIYLPGHAHQMEIPAHSHNITAGIFESGSPTHFDIYIDGDMRASVDSTSYNDDIVMWLLGEDGLVPRNRWIDMEIRPNDNAYVVASVFIQGFVQSRGGGNY